MNNQLQEQDAFYDSHFKEITIEKEILREKEFEKCIFEKVTFSSLTIENSRFLDCTFKNCILNVVKIQNSIFDEVKIKDSKCNAVDWSGENELIQLYFQNSNLNYSSFFACKCTKLEMIECTTKEVDFTQAQLTEAKLHYTDFAGANFHNTDLTKADFSNARNYSINITSNKLRKAIFTLPEAVSLLRGIDVIIK